MTVSPNPLCQCDEDALGAAEVAEALDLLVLRHLAKEFGTMLLQAGKDVIDVSDGKHDAIEAQRPGRRVFRLDGHCRWRVILREFEPAVAVRSPHHCDFGPDAGEAHDAVHPISFDLHPALQQQAKFGKELDCSIEVLNDDGDVVHPQKLGRRLLFSFNLISHCFSHQILAGIQPYRNTFR